MSNSLQPHELYTAHRILQARILEWVAVPFSRGPSQPRIQTQVSRTAGGFFTSWATRKRSLYHTCHTFHAAAAKSLQSCLTLCNPIDSRPPGSTVPRNLQARTLEWVAISFSNAWKWKVKVKSLSRVLLLATPWTAAHQAPLSMGFSRQEYWSGCQGLLCKLYTFYHCGSFLQLLLQRGVPGSETLNMRVRRICCLTNLEMMALCLGDIILLEERGGKRG